jgi:[ribosomal protein S18]-alanine N-acetyltransferase
VTGREAESGGGGGHGSPNSHEAHGVFGAHGAHRASGGHELREMRWWDIEPVLALESTLFPEDAWSRQMFWAELAHARGPEPTRRYLVAEAVDDRTPAGPRALAGYGGLAAVAGTGDIQTIGVLPAHQGTGLGARLLAALLTAAAADFGCREVLLEVRVDNARAQRLYERFGFVPVGVRRGYYQPGDVDALVMRLDRFDHLDGAGRFERVGHLDHPERLGGAEQFDHAEYPGPPRPLDCPGPPDPPESPASSDNSRTRNTKTHGHGIHGIHGIQG